MELRKNEHNQIVLNKKTFIQLAQGDKFIYSPQNKLIFVLTPVEETVFMITGYDLKGISKGSYVYKNAIFSKFCYRHGCVNIVYCSLEPNGNKCWYQGKLLEMGYITDLFALHRTDSEGVPVDMMDKPIDDVEAVVDGYSVEEETLATPENSVASAVVLEKPVAAAEDVTSAPAPIPVPIPMPAPAAESKVEITKPAEKSNDKEIEDILAGLPSKKEEPQAEERVELTKPVAPAPIPVSEEPPAEEGTKECVMCGLSIKQSAMFCPLCGAQQE